MAGAPRRYGMLTPPPPAVAEVKAPSFRELGWLQYRDDNGIASMLGPGWGPVYASNPQLQEAPFDPAVQNPKRGTSAFRVASRQLYLYSDPPELPAGTTLWRLQPIVRKTPQQYGTDEFALGHYAPFRLPRPTGTAPGSPPLLAEMQNSIFQGISRGGHVLVSMTESSYEGGPGAAARRFANTRFGLWFKAWVIGGANVRPLGTQQTPSPQFRGVLPTYGYTTLPQVIGG